MEETSKLTLSQQEVYVIFIDEVISFVSSHYNKALDKFLEIIKNNDKDLNVSLMKCSNIGSYVLRRGWKP